MDIVYGTSRNLEECEALTLASTKASPLKPQLDTSETILFMFNLSDP